MKSDNSESYVKNTNPVVLFIITVCLHMSILPMLVCMSHLSNMCSLLSQFSLTFFS